MKAAAMVPVLALALAGCGAKGSAGVDVSPIAKAFELRGTNSVSDGKPVPARYTCDGAGASPALTWVGVPEGTKELALLLEDRDAPSGTFTHWLVYHIDPSLKHVPSQTLGWTAYVAVARGRNDFGSTGYQGPCPPPGQTHHYVFRLFALAEKLTSPTRPIALRSTQLPRATCSRRFG
jgi:Raf kinase inhibitor-like YbhB/YbcL family protein